MKGRQRPVMDVNFKEILDGLPDKPPRSRLEPYRELIRELRQRGRTYRDIAHILAEKCQIQVTASGVCDFVQKRSRAKSKPAGRLTGSVRTEQRQSVARHRVKPNLKSSPRPASSDDVQQKIAALKAREPGSGARPEKFKFDPSEPLRLKKRDKKTSD